MHQPHQPVHPLQQSHSHLHTLNHQQQQQQPTPQHHPLHHHHLHPPTPGSLQQSQQSLSTQQPSSMHLSPSMHQHHQMQSQQQPHHHQQLVPHQQQHHHLTHLNHPHASQQLQHVPGPSQQSHALPQSRQQQTQHHQHQSQSQHQLPPTPHHHMTHPSASSMLMNHSQYPNLMYAQMGSHAYVPSAGHVPPTFNHPSTPSQHRPETVGSGTQQSAPPPTQQSSSINPNPMSHMAQIGQSTNQNTGAANVHQSNNGSVMDSHMQSRLPLNQSYMMTNPYMHNAFYNQSSGASNPTSGYYGYDQCYSQVPTDPYSHSNSSSTSHWPTSAPSSGMMNSSTMTSNNAQLRPPAGPSGPSIPAQVAPTPLPPLAARPPLASRTPERSPAPPIASSYPSPNQQGSTKSGSNSLAQLEQMVMPGSGPSTTPLKSPNQRSTTSSPSTNALQPQPMQYLYNSGGSGSYFNTAANQSQASYYPTYESSENVDQAKPGWSEQAPNSVMIPPPPSTGPGIDGNMNPYSHPQGYEGSSGYGDYTQLSTPSQSRFTSSDMPTEQPHIDKSDPYAIDSQTFEDHEDQTASTKTKKGRAKKSDDPNKKERRQRAPRGSKAAAAAAAAAAVAAAASANLSSPIAATSNSTPITPAAVAVGTTTPTLPMNAQPQSPSISSIPVQQTPSRATMQPMSDESTQAVAETQDPAALPADGSSMALDNIAEKPYANHEIQPSSAKSAIPSTQVDQIAAPGGTPNSSFSKSPVQRSSTNSPIVSAQQTSQYSYGPVGPEPLVYGPNASANQGSYYSPYDSVAPSMSQPPETSWPVPLPQSMVPVPTSSSMSADNGTIMYDSSYSGPSGYGQYTQLSTPSQNKNTATEQVQQESSQVDKSDLNQSESRGIGEQEDQVAIAKPKRSRAKKSDDSSKKERKQRVSKSQKSATPTIRTRSPHEDSTVLNDVSLGAQEEKTEALCETSEAIGPTVDQDETLAGDVRLDEESKAKPKRVRPKKGEGKPKRERKSRAAPKLTPPPHNEETTPPPMNTDQPDVIASSATSGTFQDEQQAATIAETTPVKPKRIRIRDSSSKGKKKLPKFALKFAKTKKRKRLGSSDNEQSDLDKTPPPSPDEAESGVQKRRSARNTKKLKYNDDIELGFSESDDESDARPRKKSSSAKETAENGDSIEESVVAEEPTVFAAPVEDTMVVEKIMASRTGTRELEPEPGEVLPPDGTFIDVEEFYVKYKNMSYLHCDWRTLEELEKGDRRVAQKVKRFKQKKDSSNVFSFMDEDLFDAQYCEVDRILAVNEVEEMVPDSEEEAETKTGVNSSAIPNLEASITLTDKDDKPAETSPENEAQKVEASVATIPAPICEGSKDAATGMIEQLVADGDSKIKTEPTDSSVSEQSASINVDDSSATIDQTNLNSDTKTLVDEKPKKMKKKISRHYLVKWRALSYEDSTWELEEHLDPEKIKQFERFKDPPPKSKWKTVKRPKPEEWVRKEASPVYKNGNTLREYQLEGINWLSFCWHQGRNCILADEMGLGKTIQSIAFVNEIYEKGIYGPYLIIVPLSTVGNWAREFETWTDLNVITYHGSSTSREMLKEYEMFYRNEQGNRITSVYKFQVMITTFEIVLSDCLDLREIPWRCCIIDEAHRLKNRNCKLLEGLRLLNMEHRVLLTGTPLQNNVEELFSLLNFLEPTQFSSTEQFLLEFGDLKTEAQVDKLKLILKPMMLRRLKEDVEKTLAPKEETIVEVELTNIQKKYYRAILERNFSFLQKGSTNNNMPNLMNTMMELRKCCIHPYLINGAEEQILYEARQTKMAGGEPMGSHQAMVNASGKLVLIDKLLPRLRADGHRVLIFSQMVRCLDILEDYVTNKHYPYERIDGRVRGSDRQQAIDRFSKPGSDRFVFLLCTRAGGLGINLTAADTVIIFDSDWNPQNDLQAQARCHRIGQSKAVKIYRLICRNTYEREMFDKASLKLGLDKAVLQSMNTQKTPGGGDGQLTKKEIEELLRKGAYGALMDDDNAGDKFCEEDIDQILQRRTQVITIESAEAKGSTFSKATFSSSNNREDIELDDPNFWEKWAKKANIETEDLDKDELIQLAPRRRTQTKRYGADGTLLEMSDLDSSEEDEETISMRTRGSRRGQSKPAPSSASKKGKKNRMLDHDDDDFIANIDGGYWSRYDCVKIEEGLLKYGWGRWDEIINNYRLKRDITPEDCESICRVILLYCLNSYKGDEKIKSFVWELITPPEESSKSDSENNSSATTRGRRPKSTAPVVKKSVAEDILDANWPKEARNDPLIALPDDQYRRHLQRHCNKLLIRVKVLHYLKYEILKEHQIKVFDPHCNASSIDLPPVQVDGDLPASWWDDEADRSLLIGIYKHGHDNSMNRIRSDTNLCFLDRCGPPNAADLHAEINGVCMGRIVSEDNRISSNLRKTAAGLCLDDLVNNIVNELADTIDSKSTSHDIVDENKNSILKNSETCDSFDNICENGVGESSQTAKMDITDDDSLLNESSIDTLLSRSNIGVSGVQVEPEENGHLPFPSDNDLIQRFRRLITAYQRNSKRIELELAQKARDELKKERTSKFEAAKNEREERKRSQAQKWSRREESDFTKAISFFGVEYDAELEKFDWRKFRSIGKLEKKLDDTLEEYYKAFVTMCKKVASKPMSDEEEKCSINVEPIPEDRAIKCLSRIEFFNKIRETVLKHPDLDERLKLCQSQTDLPDWWENGIHDRDLLVAVAKHGLYRLDYNLAYDLSLSFDAVIQQRVEHLFSNPPASILIPLESLQELLEKNGIEYSKDVELEEDDDEIIKSVINSVIDNLESEDTSDLTSSTQRGKTTRSSSGISRSNIVVRRGANTIVKSVDSSCSGKSLRLSSQGDSRISDKRVAEVTPVLPDNIPNELRKAHEAGEVTVTIISDSVLLKLDNRPHIVLLGASNPINIKIRWPKDKALQTRLEHLIYLFENGEWPSLAKATVPTITLPNHLTAPSPTPSQTVAPTQSPSKSELPPSSPKSDISSISSKANRSEAGAREIVPDAPVTRARRGKSRKPKHSEPMEPIRPESPREERQSTAKLRNLLSQGASSPKTSTPISEKSSSKSSGDKNSPNLSSLLASYKQNRNEGGGSSSRSRDDKKNSSNASLSNSLSSSLNASSAGTSGAPNVGNFLPQILANMDPKFRDLLSNPEAVTHLMNSFNSLTGNLGSSLRSPITSTATNPSFDGMVGSHRSLSKGQRSDRSSKYSNLDKQSAGNIPSLLASFKQPKSGSSSRGRDERNLLDQTAANAGKLLPQILARPEVRDLLANPETASVFMNSLSGLTGGTNFGLNLRGTDSQGSLEGMLNQSPSTSSKGPPPAHQRADNVSTAHGSSSRELRRNSQSNREQPSRSSRGRGSAAPVEDQQKSEDSSGKSSSSKRRGRQTSITLDPPSGPAPTGTDVLDLSSLPLPRKGNSLLRSESRTRRGREQPEEVPAVSTRSSSSSSSKAAVKMSSKNQQLESESDKLQEPEQQTNEKGGRQTRASKRIGSRIDALALNLQAKRMNRSESPDLSPTISKEKTNENPMLAHGSGASSTPTSSENRSQSVKAPPAAHSGSHKSGATNSSSEQPRERHHRDKERSKHNTSAQSMTQNQATPNLQSTSSRAQDPLAQLMSISSNNANLSMQPGPSAQARQDPLAQLMSNPTSLLAGLNPSALGSAGDIMNQLLRKSGSNDMLKNLLNEFVKNPNLAALDPNILATLTAGLPMNSQSLPSFNMPTSVPTSLPYGNYANPLANPFLPFSMANLGMNNPLGNPLGLFPNLYMPTATRFPTPDQHQQQQQHQHQQQQQQQQRQPNQSTGTSDGSSKDKKMRYSRK